jgi:hypothetical protein
MALLSSLVKLIARPGVTRVAPGLLRVGIPLLRVAGPRRGEIRLAGPPHEEFAEEAREWIAMLHTLLPETTTIAYDMAGGRVDLHHAPTGATARRVEALISVAVDVAPRFLTMDRDTRGRVRRRLSAALDAGTVMLDSAGGEEALRKMVEQAQID